MGENNIQKPNNEIINAVNFALQKFLIQVGTIEAEGKILANQLHNLKTKVKIKKINSIIQKH